MEDNEVMESLETQRWLPQRQLPGNWIDVAKTDEIPSDIIGWRRTILHLFQIAFAPEIRRRLSKKQLSDDFCLSAAQLIQPHDDENEVRLNEEVRGLALVRAARTVHKGEPVFLSDLKGFVSFDLPDDELDAAHFTMLWNGSEWIFSFDFRAGRAECFDMLAAARQFLDISKQSASKEYERPSVDNLFSAMNNLCGCLTGFQRSVHQLSTIQPLGFQLPSQSDFHVVEREIDELMESVAPRVDR